jgi:hypothetical protein
MAQGHISLSKTFIYLLPSPVYHYFFLLEERSFLEIDARGGEILEECVKYGREILE